LLVRETPYPLALFAFRGLYGLTFTHSFGRRAIFFNGDKLYHAVSPIAEGEMRIVLTLQYVTDPAMSFTHRWFSNMKDAVGYFGWSALFRRPTR